VETPTQWVPRTAPPSSRWRDHGHLPARRKAANRAAATACGGRAAARVAATAISVAAVCQPSTQVGSTRRPRPGAARRQRPPSSAGNVTRKRHSRGANVHTGARCSSQTTLPPSSQSSASTPGLGSVVSAAPAPASGVHCRCRHRRRLDAAGALSVLHKISRWSGSAPAGPRGAAPRRSRRARAAQPRARPPRTGCPCAVLLKAWAHASSKSARFGLRELVGNPLTVPCGPIFSTSGLQQGFARIALVKFISQEASRGGADCECKRTRFHAAELRFRVRQQPPVSNPARNLR